MEKGTDLQQKVSQCIASPNNLVSNAPLKKHLDTSAKSPRTNMDNLKMKPLQSVYTGMQSTSDDNIGVPRFAH